MWHMGRTELLVRAPHVFLGGRLRVALRVSLAHFRKQGSGTPPLQEAQADSAARKEEEGRWDGDTNVFDPTLDSEIGSPDVDGNPFGIERQDLKVLTDPHLFQERVGEEGRCPGDVTALIPWGLGHIVRQGRAIQTLLRPCGS